MNKQKSLFYSILSINVLMLIYYSLLAIFNTFSQDDFYFFIAIKEQGILNFVKGTYLTHSGRFSYYFHEGILYTFLVRGMSLWINQLVVYSLSLLIIYSMIKRFFPLTALSSTLNISAFLLHVFLFVNFEFSSFYWSCATVYYLMALVPVALFLLVTKEKNSFLSYVFLFLFSVWVGGISEALVPISLIMMFFYFLFLFYKNKFSWKETWKLTVSKKMMFSSLILLIGFLIIYFAPGNQIRMQEFEQAGSILSMLKISLHSTTLYFYLFLFKLPYLLPLIFLFIYLGKKDKRESRLTLKQILFSFLLFVVFIWFNVLPSAYAISGFGFHRVYSHTVFLSILYVLFLSYKLGKYLPNLSEKTNLFVLYIMLLIFSLNISFHLYKDIPMAYTYKKGTEQRISYLLEQKENNVENTLVVCEPLPPMFTYSFKYLILGLFNKADNPRPVLYYPNEISIDSEGYINQGIKQFYELDFDIKLKAE